MGNKMMTPMITKLRLKSLIGAFATAFLISSPLMAYDTLGLYGGLSFPKLAFLKLDLNLADSWGAEAQGSLGVYWSIQQADLLYYFYRGQEWSWYLGAGYQNWNFYGFSANTNYSGIFLGNSAGSQAGAITAPLGLVYYEGSGMALNLSVGATYFTSGPDDIRGKTIPEAQLALGFYF